MTAFIGQIGKDFAILGTDTLATYPLQSGDNQLRPRSYTSKTFLLPQFRSAFAVTGTLQVGLCFYNLITESAFGIDIDSLTNIDLKDFHQMLSAEYESYPTGTIYLTGYSESRKFFKGFKLLIGLNTELNWQKLTSDSIIFKPPVDNWEDKLAQTGTKTNYCELIVDLMKIQKIEDDQKLLIDRVCIGGEVLCTKLMCNQGTDKLTIVTQLVHRFEDYIFLGNKMIKNNMNSD